MATQLFLINTDPDVHTGTDHLRLDGASQGWIGRALGTARGSGVTTPGGTATAAGPTSGIEVIAVSGGKGEWISPPVSADVTISGTITANIWGRENDMNANCAINVVIDILRSNVTGTRDSNTVVQIVKSTRVTEMAVSTTTNSVSNFTTGMASGGYTSQTLNRGDRLRIRVFADDAGTMGASFTFSVGFNGTTAAADGDTYVTFAENFSFESAPAGSQVFLTDTVSDVATASVDREAWTSRGGGVVNDVTNTATGWTAPIQVTDTAGGTVADWFTKQLQAFTLTGMAVANLRALVSNVAANASLRCEIARVDSDGTNPTVWGSWCIAPISADSGELTTSEVARTANVSGDDLAFTNGQRIRIRIYIEDESHAAMVTAHTVTFFYNGTSGGASGDSFVTLPQSVSEFVAGEVIPDLVMARR